MESNVEYTPKPWHITIPPDLPAHLRPACDFINTELALDPPFAAPNLYASSPVNLGRREKSLRTVMQGLEWRFRVQQKISSDATQENTAKVLEWIEWQGAFGVLREEEVEEERIRPELEHGWIDEDGKSFNDDQEVFTTEEEEMHNEQIEDLD
ncbi:hypothetical protein E8E11_006087 [Didymella keratinophila]|nr:hypothetical protein E8E11_006087 [Didymella keratinophila]